MAKKFYISTVSFQNNTAIEMLSIGIVYEDGQKYYALCSDANNYKNSDYYVDLIVEDETIIRKTKTLIDIEALIFIMKCVGYENIGYNLLDIRKDKIMPIVRNRLIKTIKDNPKKLNDVEWISIDPAFDWICLSSIFGGERKMVELGISTNYISFKQLLYYKQLDLSTLEKTISYGSNKITSINNAVWLKSVYQTLI